MVICGALPTTLSSSIRVQYVLYNRRACCDRCWSGLGITQANKNIARGLRNTEYGYCTPDVPHVSDVFTSGAGPAPEAKPVDIEVRTPLVRRNGGRVLTMGIFNSSIYMKANSLWWAIGNGNGKHAETVKS